MFVPAYRRFRPPFRFLVWMKAPAIAAPGASGVTVMCRRASLCTIFGTCGAYPFSMSGVRIRLKAAPITSAVTHLSDDPADQQEKHQQDCGGDTDNGDQQALTRNLNAEKQHGHAPLYIHFIYSYDTTSAGKRKPPFSLFK